MTLRPPPKKCNISNPMLMLIGLTWCLVSSKAESIPSPIGESTRPNIIVLFADNLGYDDIGTFSSSPSSSKTPNIDSLATTGLKLKNWNSASHLCSSSRAALLTGKYPVKTGVYPGVFQPDAVHGLSPNETTIAEHLKPLGYATGIVGKWHLGQREEYLPLNQGFDEWFGIPYHMSGGSLEGHVCGEDTNGTMWLPLFQGTEIVEQPVNLYDLAPRYASFAREFIQKHAVNGDPFFLYVPFSHVHQLCAPKHAECQWASHEFSKTSPRGTFGDALEEMDWIAGEVLDAVEEAGIGDNTLVLFTSDNGPWVAEKECSGSKGPFEGRWLIDNVHQSCTACPSRYRHSPIPSRPRRCIYTTPSQIYEADGVHCGEDTGLGSTWEANLRMPALVRWPNHVPPGSQSSSLVSTLDVLPTILALLGIDIPQEVDGLDISHLLQNPEGDTDHPDGYEERVLFFWRDGFSEGPLPQPYGRYDVTAVKVGQIKAWFYTKSGHYNPDVEVFHDPPLLFNVLDDPAEAFPLDPSLYEQLLERLPGILREHKESMGVTFPLCLERDVTYLPCVDVDRGCRTKPIGVGDDEGGSKEIM